MDGREWEDLDSDCLVNIFERVGMDSLLFSIPFVCKSWYKETLDPQCWKKIVFPNILLQGLSSHDKNDIWRLSAFVKFVVKRSNRSATFLELPSYCAEEAFTFLANECPDLRTLILPRDVGRDVMALIPNHICKWKNLENLRISDCGFLEPIIAHIGIHCKGFVSLAVPRAHIGKEEALAIVTFLPNIKYLRLTNAYMEKENLVMILQGCKHLEFASRIRTFMLEGSSLDDYVDFMDPYCFQGVSFFDDDWA